MTTTITKKFWEEFLISSYLKEKLSKRPFEIRLHEIREEIITDDQTILNIARKEGHIIIKFPTSILIKHKYFLHLEDGE